MKERILTILAVLAVPFIGYAVAQGVYNPQIPPPAQLTTIGTSDLIQVIPGGVGGVPNKYATAAQIDGVPGYTYTTPLTAFSLTFANGQTNMILAPAGTLATGTVTTQPSPVSDGQRECVMSTQTQTALTVTANTGQTIAAPTVTALVAVTPVCWTYVAAQATWWRSP